MGRFAGRAAITWSSTGDTNTERVHLLDVPLRELRPAHSLTHFTRESLDKSTIETFTLGSGAHELVGAIRYDGNPQSLMDLIVAGSENRTLTYYPDLNDPDVSYACLLVAPRSPAELSLDPQRGMFGDQSAELRLRRTDESRFHPLYVASNVLFWFRAGDALTGATFARTGTNARYVTKGQGVLTAAAANAARIEWVDLDGDYVRETPGLLLEAAVTNLITDSEALSAWTSVGTPGLTDSQADPESGTDAYLVEDDDAAATEGVFLAVTFTGNATKVASVFVKQGTSTRNTVEIYDATAATARHGVFVTWTNGVPALSTNEGSGTLYDPERLQNGWWRIAFSAAGVLAANSNRMYLFPTDKTDASTGTAYFFGAQAENGTIPTSYIPTASGTAARGADSLSFPYVADQQAMTVYVRFIERGTITNADARILNIGGQSDNALYLYQPSGVGFYRCEYNRRNSATATARSSTATLAVAPAQGDTVELIGQITATGAVKAIQSINGATPTETALSSAAGLEQGWTNAALGLNSDDDGTNAAYGLYFNAVAVRGVHDMVAMRRIAKV